MSKSKLKLDKLLQIRKINQLVIDLLERNIQPIDQNIISALKLNLSTYGSTRHLAFLALVIVFHI